MWKRKQALQNFRSLLFTIVKHMEFGMIITNGKVFVSLDFDKYSPYLFSMTLKDHSPNTLMFNAMKRYNFWKLFLENFKMGNVYFENQKIKHNLYELIKLYFSK